MFKVIKSRRNNKIHSISTIVASLKIRNRNRSHHFYQKTFVTELWCSQGWESWLSCRVQGQIVDVSSSESGTCGGHAQTSIKFVLVGCKVWLHSKQILGLARDLTMFCSASKQWINLRSSVSESFKQSMKSHERFIVAYLKRNTLCGTHTIVIVMIFQQESTTFYFSYFLLTEKEEKRIDRKYNKLVWQSLKFLLLSRRANDSNVIPLTVHGHYLSKHDNERIKIFMLVVK